ncbi:MAG: glycosyltransferase family 4 protein, partial [Planctomycetes bacterium]|nr:glycosyltransferase family 4 protein [Planctomycetota bacterium]
MRILAVANFFFPDAPGGLERVAWDVAKAMARRGHHVGLLAGDRSARARRGASRTDAIDGVYVTRYPKPVMSPLDPFRDAKQIDDAASAIRDLLGSSDYDILHCHSIFTAHAAMRAAPAVPIVQTVHSPAIQELSYNWLRKGVIGRLTAIAGTPRVRHLEGRTITAATRRHALSRFTVSQMLTEYPASPAGYEVIPHWADPAWFRSMSKAEARQRLGWPSDEPIMFTVRQLRWRYGIDTAVEAIAPAAKAGRCCFFIAGEGEERGRLEEGVRRHDAEDRVKLLGRISDEELRLAYQAADVFILPTRALECFGLIIVEALACGLPVIGTAMGAIPENLEPILPDWLVPGDDPAALRRKV